MDYDTKLLELSNATVECCNGKGSLNANQSFLSISFAFICFCILFLLVWSLFTSYYRRFSTMTLALQADVCSRPISIIHSIIIVPSLIGGIAYMNWGDYFEPLGDVSFLQGILCISIGYFLYDTVLLLIYRPPQWLGFAVHHIVASIPYVIYMFASPCEYGLFILCCFLLVEATNLPLHARATLEENDMSNTKAYATALYATFVGWIIFRLANPTALIIIIHKYIIPSIPNGRLACIIPGVICAYMINIFCYAVFVFILCKEVLLRWKRSPLPGEVAPSDTTRPVDLNSEHMTADELNIVAECPTRLLVYEAQESIRERLEKSRLSGRLSQLRGEGDDTDGLTPI
ncbi:hypothetical protein LSM04_000609 [Trypanosoma melophagium]|uniref:uncharacterized protein n=1 Tax=Trypanosoma melophagium TaxID=715481 RepID=UPI00351A05C3|nr:hypothetical protein LSM04_000609 [Trypanosoma melophagium]